MATSDSKDVRHTDLRDYCALLGGNPNFFLLWLGEVVTQLGSFFNLVAGYKVVGELSGYSGVAVALLLIMRNVPRLLWFPLAGPVADLFNRGVVMGAVSLLQTAVVLSVPLLMQSTRSLTLFYVLQFVEFSLAAFYDPARGALIPMVVKEEELVAAATLDSLGWSLMAAFGASAGGYAVSALHVWGCYYVDAVTFLVAALCAWRMVPLAAAAHKAALDQEAHSQAAADTHELQGGSKGAHNPGTPRKQGVILDSPRPGSPDQLVLKASVGATPPDRGPSPAGATPREQRGNRSCAGRGEDGGKRDQDGSQDQGTDTWDSRVEAAAAAAAPVLHGTAVQAAAGPAGGAHAGGAHGPTDSVQDGAACPAAGAAFGASAGAGAASAGTGGRTGGQPAAAAPVRLAGSQGAAAAADVAATGATAAAAAAAASAAVTGAAAGEDGGDDDAVTDVALGMLQQLERQQHQQHQHQQPSSHQCSPSQRRHHHHCQQHPQPHEAVGGPCSGQGPLHQAHAAGAWSGRCLVDEEAAWPAGGCGAGGGDAALEGAKEGQSMLKGGGGGGSVEAGGAGKGRGYKDRLLALVSGFAYLLAPHNRDLLLFVTIKSCGALSWGGNDVLIAKWSEMKSMQLLGDDSATLGTIYAMVGVGCFVGPFVVNRFIRPTTAGLLLSVAVGFALRTVGYLLMAVGNFWMVLLFSVVRSAGSNVIWIASTTLLQRRADNRHQGSVFAVELAAYTGAMCVSTASTGWGFDMAGVDAATMCLWLGLVTAVLLAFWAGVSAAYLKRERAEALGEVRYCALEMAEPREVLERDNCSPV